MLKHAQKHQSPSKQKLTLSGGWWTDSTRKEILEDQKDCYQNRCQKHNPQFHNQVRFRLVQCNLWEFMNMQN